LNLQINYQVDRSFIKLSATFFEQFFSFTGFFFSIFGYFQTMPKWLRNLIFNAVRTYSYIRRAICRAMDQLAAMLARAAVPSGTSTEGTGPAEGMTSSTPLLSGSPDLPDREVCVFFILLIDVLSGECQLLWGETILSYLGVPTA
jgi:hypothetical protein